MTLKEGSLFSGYHGLGMGVGQVLDVEPVWFSEYDKGPSKILAHRFPGVPNHGDITKIDWSQVEPVDILTGGSPCQDLSHAGRRAGAQLRPSLVIWENVGGAFSAAADSEVEPCAGCVGDGRGVHLRALRRQRRVSTHSLTAATSLATDPCTSWPRRSPAGPTSTDRPTTRSR